MTQRVRIVPSISPHGPDQSSLSENANQNIIRLRRPLKTIKENGFKISFSAQSNPAVILMFSRYTERKRHTKHKETALPSFYFHGTARRFFSLRYILIISLEWVFLFSRARLFSSFYPFAFLIVASVGCGGRLVGDAVDFDFHEIVPKIFFSPKKGLTSCGSRYGTGMLILVITLHES